MKTRLLMAILAACLIAFSFSQNTFAQEGPYAHLNVFVWNQLHTAGQSSAQVWVVNSNGQTILEGNTNSEGWADFNLTGIGSGTYTINACYPARPNDYCSGYVVWVYSGPGSAWEYVALGNTY